MTTAIFDELMTRAVDGINKDLPFEDIEVSLDFNVRKCGRS